jgi:AcrR family transcriptional regulator
MPRRTSQPTRQDPRAPIIDAALRLASQRSWRSLSLAEIAAEAKVGVLALHELFRSKTAILAAFQRRIDAAVLAGAGSEAESELPRDALFDTVMRRFDALSPYKPALALMARDAFGDPLAALCGVPAMLNSMAWVLEASGLSAAGWVGRVRAKLLLGIYLSVLRIWLTDDSPDMAKTMAALDRRLRLAERWLGAGPRGGNGLATAAAGG